MHCRTIFFLKSRDEVVRFLLYAINRDMREHIDSCHNESESRTAYLDHSTAHFNDVAKITSDSDSITQQKKKNGREENSQKNHEIPFEENEAKNSIIASETIVPNASETIVPKASEAIEKIARKTVNASKKIEQNASKKIKAGAEKYFLTCIKNILA